MQVTRRLAASCAISLLAGCATTVRDDSPVEPTWRSARAAEAPAVGAESVAVYVASFGLAAAVAERHPELAEARAGWGISQRIVDALYDSGRFRFLEEKAEMAERLADFRVRPAAEPEGGEGSEPGRAREGPDAARWLLYGELVEVREARTEGVAGLRSRVETEIRVTVQIRLVERDGGRFFPATGEGAAVIEAGRNGDGGLDAAALATATGEAVRAAADRLAERLEDG